MRICYVRHGGAGAQSRGKIGIVLFSQQPPAPLGAHAVAAMRRASALASNGKRRACVRACRRARRGHGRRRRDPVGGKCTRGVVTGEESSHDGGGLVVGVCWSCALMPWLGEAGCSFRTVCDYITQGDYSIVSR